MSGSVFTRVLVLFSALVLPASVHASRVSPMSVEVAPLGRESVARVQFVNTSTRDFPVEARVHRGEISEDGELELIPADDDFIIFPPQLVIAPRAEQVFRIQYIGEPELDRAHVYYLSIAQLPVELEPGTPQVQVLVNFNVFVNVEPASTVAEPRIDTISAELRDEKEGVLVRVVNDGNGMLLASELEWSVTGQNLDGSEFNRQISPAELGSIIGAGIVAPGKARKFFLPLAEGVDRSTIAISVG